MDKYVLKLYVAGQAERSQRAIASVQRICEEQLQGRCALEVVDVQKQPRLGEAAGILATPTLVRELPAPARRVVGDLSQAETVLRSLDLRR